MDLFCKMPLMFSQTAVEATVGQSAPQMPYFNCHARHLKRRSHTTGRSQPT